MAIDRYPSAASRSRLLPLVTVLACAMLAACGAAPVAELTATPSGRAVAGGLPQSPQEAQELREKLHRAVRHLRTFLARRRDRPTRYPCCRRTCRR